MAVMLWIYSVSFCKHNTLRSRGGRQAVSRPTRAQALHTLAQDADVVHQFAQDWASNVT